MKFMKVRRRFGCVPRSAVAEVPGQVRGPKVPLYQTVASSSVHDREGHWPQTAAGEAVSVWKVLLVVRIE